VRLSLQPRPLMTLMMTLCAHRTTKATGHLPPSGLPHTGIVVETVEKK